MRHISRKGEDHPGQRVSMRGYWPRGPSALAVVLACGLVLCTSLAGAARAAAPEFDANLPTTLSVAENSALGTNVGSPFTASDADNDTLSYSLEGTDRDNFRISNTGQLSTDAHLDYEAKTSHSVTLKVSAGTESDTHDVTINIANQSDTGDSSLNPSGSDPTVARKSRATYSIRILGSWDRGVTPEGVPSGDHFTTFVGGIHNDQVTFLQDGQTASSGVESMAEVGGTSRLQSEVNAQKPNADRAVTFGAPSVTGTRTHTGVTFTSDHPRITLTSMIAPSPDWFVGVSGRSLLNSSGNWLDSLTVNLYPWDAGTENGTEFSLSNPSTNPRGVITSIRGLGKFTGEHIAQFTFTRSGSVELAPAAPTGFGVSASDRAVTLNWDLPSASDISRHEYRRKTTGGYRSWTSIPNSAPSESNEDSFTVSPLENDTEYTFQLRAVNSLGNGDASGEMSATPMGAANAAPSFSSSSTFDVDENTTGVGTVVASDMDDEDEVTSYEITDGADRSRFSILRTTGALVFDAAPNFESPADVASSDPVNAGGNNEYLLVVTAKSGAGAREMSAQQSITVTVRDVNEPPVIPATSTFDVDENTTGVGTVVASDADDADEVTSYEITGGADRSRFSILRTTGALVFDAARNFESPADVSSSDPVNAGGNNEYLLVVTAKSGSGAREMSAQQSITVTVLDVNEPPVIPATSSFGVDENTTAVGTVVASDMDDEDEVTSYEVTDGADRSRFSIGRTRGALVFNAAPNFESPADVSSSDPVNAGGNNEYLLVVTAKSGSGAREMSAQQSITVTVRNVNEPPGRPAAPTLSASTSTSLTVAWTAPGNLGAPDITGYDLQYMETSEISFRNGPQNQTGTSASITGLEAGTEHQVQVRASNAEGDSRWSESLTASTQMADPVNLSLSLSDAQISENGGSATVTASLDRTSSASTTVTISATPVPPAVAADYSLSSNRVLTIAAGSLASTGTVTLTAVDNDIDGPDKTVTIRAAVTSDAEVSDPARLRLLIEDEDTRGVTVSAARLDIDEGETGTFTVVLDSQPTGVVRVRPLRESGDTDITPSGALSFTADNWDRPQTVRVTAAEDADAADDSAVISHRVGGADYASVTASSVAVTATDNDLASTGVTLSLTPMSVGEAAGATPVTVTASLSDGARTLDTEIRVSVGSGTASAGSDFAEVEEFVIRIAANSQSGTGEFSLLPTDDALYETDETVQVMGSSSEQGLAVRGASITIEDDDEAPPLTVRAVPDKALTLGQGSIQVSLEAFFGHPDGDALTYAAESSDERIVAVRLDGSRLIVTPVAIGVAEIRVIAKDTDGSGEQGSVEFQAVVALEERRFSVNPNPDDVWTLTVQGRSGPVRITLPPGQGRVALDSDGDGDVDAADIEATVTEVDESRVPPAPQGLEVDENSAVDIKFANPPAGRTLICLSTQWDSSLPLLVARFNAATNQWEWLPSDVADEDGTTSVCAETRVFSVFAVLDGTGRDVSLADVNANAVVEADDALVMYYAFAFPDLLGDSSGGGVVRFRRALLGDALPGSPSDADLRELLRRANQWRDMGMSFGGDLNGDAAIDEQDALVMYYAYQFEDRLGNGETGGDPGLRQRLLGGLAGFSDADDATLRRMLRRANSIRRAL